MLLRVSTPLKVDCHNVARNVVPYTSAVIFILVPMQVSELGGVPLMTKTADMSNTIPDEKVSHEARRGRRSRNEQICEQ